MPRSKHRKKPTAKKQKPTNTKRVTKVESGPSAVNINPEKFDELRSSRDFVALVKIGRPVNAVTFGMQVLDDYRDNVTHVGRRQSMRAIFIIGGYLHEGLALVDSLQPYYTRMRFIKSWHF